MTNKILISIIVILLVFAVAESFNTGMIVNENSLLNPFGIAELVALIMMLINGTFISWRYFKLTYVVLGFILLGVIFKILHLTGADQLIIISLPLVLVVYSIHFAKKENKQLLDILKLVLIFLKFIGGVLIIEHLFPGDSYLYVILSDSIVWITFSYFLIMGIRARTLFS